MTLTKEQKREIAWRLENWAKWREGGGTGPRRISGAPFPAYNLVNIGGRDDSDCNNVVAIGDAEDTDRVTRMMHPDHVRALVVHYVWSATFTPKARARACRTSVRTYFRRVARAEVVFNRLIYRIQHRESIGQIGAPA